MSGAIASSAWFGPDRRSALDDFFAVYEANIELAEVLRANPEVEELVSLARKPARHGVRCVRGI